MNRQDWAVLDQILTDDFLFTLPTHPDPYRGHDGFRQLVTMLHNSFPDFYMLPQEMVTNGDSVITRWRGGGTHTGGPLRTVLGDLQASGRSFEIDGMTLHRYRGSQIVESVGHEDTVGMMIQLGAMPSPPSTTVRSTSEQNRAMVDRYFYEIMNNAALGVIDEILHPDFSFIIPTMAEPVRRRDGFRGFVTYLRTAFPDLAFTPLTYTAHGQRVAVRWRINGTHEGEFLGAPATHRRVEDFGIDIFTFYDGMIREISVNENDFGLMQQLGLINAQAPQPARPSWRKMPMQGRPG
jgi:steroid delta-isomerase-like uncharacterized protein